MEPVSIARVLVPTDLSPPSLVAAQYAARLAVALGASITLLHVLPNANEMIGIVPGASVAEELKETRAAATMALAAVESTLAAGGFLRVSHLIDLAPSRTRGIVDRGRSSSFDLIVMASHGRSAIGRMVLGSVAASVLREAHCPVLMVRSDRS
jgi:nucleotide-binding universal stress UspA family protein